MNTMRTLYATMKAHTGIFPGAAVRIEHDSGLAGNWHWIVDAKTERGIKLCPTKAAAERLVQRASDRIRSEREADPFAGYVPQLTEAAKREEERQRNWK